MADTLQNILEQNLATLQADMQQAYQQENGTAADFSHTVTANTGTLLGPDLAAGADNFEQILQEWIAARGITIHNQDELDRVARFLQWWIQKNGTTQFRSAQTDPYTPLIAAFTQRLNAQVTDYYATQIQTQLAQR
ncbi:MAG: hypothetical protein P4L28_11925 [Paludibacteraceae bacterium]|nr:hypothetical protein [Paludibacteraceae bacterium]